MNRFLFLSSRPSWMSLLFLCLLSISLLLHIIYIFLSIVSIQSLIVMNISHHQITSFHLALLPISLFFFVTKLPKICGFHIPPPRQPPPESRPRPGGGEALQSASCASSALFLGVRSPHPGPGLLVGPSGLAYIWKRRLPSGSSLGEAGPRGRAGPLATVPRDRQSRTPNTWNSGSASFHLLGPNPLPPPRQDMV